MKYPFYKTGNLWIVNERYQPPGTLRMNFHDDEPAKVTFWGVNNYFNEIPARTLITDIVDENGNGYADKTALIAAIGEFFAPLEAIQIKKINGSYPGTLFGDDSRQTRRVPVGSAMWAHGLPVYGVKYSINGSGRWYIEDDPNAPGYFDGTCTFETGTDADGKIFLHSNENRYQPGQLSYFIFTAGFHGFDTSNGNYIMLFGAMTRGLQSEGKYGDIKEGIVLGFKRSNGDFSHILRIYKNFEYTEQVLSTTIPENAENLKILRLEIGYLGIHPTLVYKVNFETLSNDLEHVQVFNQEVTSLSNPNLGLGVYIENLGNTINLKIKNGSLQYGNYAERVSPDPSSRLLIDSYQIASVAGGAETAIACYTIPEKLTMVKELNESGVLTGSFYCTIANRLNKIQAFATSLAGKAIKLNVYLVPIADVVATFTYLKPNINALQRAVDVAITSVSLANAQEVTTLNYINTSKSEDISKENHLLRPGFVGVITVYSANAISDLDFSIFTEDLF